MHQTAHHSGGPATGGIATPTRPASTADAEVLSRTSLSVSVEEMPYLLDHCFFAQPEDWPRVEDRWPVVPATTMVQFMMDAAEQAVPGQKAIGVRDAKFSRWLKAAPPQRVDVTVKRVAPNLLSVALGGYARSVVEVGTTYPQPPAQAFVLALEPTRLDCVADDQQQLRQRNRFFDEIPSAEARRLDRGLDRAMAGNHDDRTRQSTAFAPLAQQADAVEIGHPDVEQDHVRALAPACITRRRGGFGDIDVNMTGGYDPTTTPADSPIIKAEEAVYKNHGIDPVMMPRLGGSWPGYVFTNPPLSLGAGHFGLGHGSGAHAPDEYYVIESANPKVASFDDAVMSYVEYLYQLAR